MSNRFKELDSIRGIASFTVVLHHCLISFSIFYAALYHNEINNIFVQVFTNSPFHIIWAGHEAVILFFVLSGFVLSLPYLNNSSLSYRSYILKRFLRIYPPYLANVMISAILFLSLKHHFHTELSGFFNAMWARPFSLKEVISYLIMTGYDTNNLDTATWSLVHEMRISIFFPLIMLFILRFDWKKSFIFGLSSSIFLSILFLEVTHRISNYMLYFLLTSISDTFYYTGFFILGAILAKGRNAIQKVFLQKNIIAKLFILICGIIFYTFEWTIPGIGSLGQSTHTLILFGERFLIDWAIAFGVSIFLIFATNSHGFKTVLHNKLFEFLGKISYSLYLIHPIVLVTYVNLVKNFLPKETLIVFVPIISLITATILYKFIEKPSIQIGRKFNNRKTISLKVSA